MRKAPETEITRILTESTPDDVNTADRLLPLIYDELRRLAHARLAQLPPGQTLQGTALVHEAYLRVTQNQDIAWHGRRHFFFAAARAMRDILVEDYRRKLSAKRGGGRKRVPMPDSALAVPPPHSDLLAIHEALDKLEQEDPDLARVVSLRYFTGLTAEQTADVMGVSRPTIQRQWRYVRAWLQHELSASGRNGSENE
ncbi:MAG: ECF-type sigma factor [Planctomycetota bacterium]